MEKYLEQKRLNLLREFNRIETSYNNRVPSEISEKYEKVFRKFLNDIFPYYDSFKGTVFGKSCDFVLADKNFHPRFEAEDDDQYYDVVTSLVDTVIELKGYVQKSEIAKGIEQAAQIKSYTKRFPLSDVTNYLHRYEHYLAGYMHLFMIYHVLVFRKGNYAVFFKYLEEKFAAIETIATKLQAFFYLPDIVFIVESNTLFQKDWKSLCFREVKDKGVLFFVKKIEEFKKTYALNADLVAFRNLLWHHFVNNPHRCLVFDGKLFNWAKEQNWNKRIQEITEAKGVEALLSTKGFYR